MGHTPSRVALALLLLLAVPACGTSYGLRGQIAGSAPCDRASPAAPLAGVHVTIACPNGAAPIDATTDANGVFSLLEAKNLDHACEVTLEKSGYETRRYPARALCRTDSPESRCGLATELLPVAAPKEAR